VRNSEQLSDPCVNQGKSDADASSAWIEIDHSNYAGRVATKADKGRSDSTDSSAAVAKKLDTVVILALAVVCTKTL